LSAIKVRAAGLRRTVGRVPTPPPIAQNIGAPRLSQLEAKP